MPSQAALYVRGNGLVYDDVQDIRWMQDGNYAETSGVSADGYMTWFEGKDFVNGIVYAGYDDWRLPSVGDVHPFDAMGRQHPAPRIEHLTPRVKQAYAGRDLDQ